MDKKLKPLSELKIMVVDDDPVSLKFAEKIFQKLGLKLTIACNGEEAIKKVISSATNYDVIFMDIEMPIKDGVTAVKEIRCFKNSNATVILAYTNINDFINSDEFGLFNGFLSKPFSKEELQKTLRSMIN